MWHHQDAHSPWCTDALIPVLTSAQLSLTILCSLVSLLKRWGRTNKTPSVNLSRVWLKFRKSSRWNYPKNIWEIRIFLFLCFFGQTAKRILVLWPGFEPRSSAGKEWSPFPLNHQGILKFLFSISLISVPNFYHFLFFCLLEIYIAHFFL